MKKEIFAAKFWRFEADSQLPFGKYEGVEVIKIFVNDPEYIGFCIRKIAKFIISVKCFEILKNMNGMWFDNNSDILYILWNKELDKRRILNEKTILVNRYREFNDNNRVVVNFKSGNQFNYMYKMKNSQLNYTGCTTDVVFENSIRFNINIIDVNGLNVFRKYNNMYGKIFVKVFEIVINAELGSVVLIVSMDFKKWNEQNPLDYQSYYECVIPDDWGCVIYTINRVCNKDVVIGERLRTEEEIQAVLKENENCNNEYFINEDEIRGQKIMIHQSYNYINDIVDDYIRYRNKIEYKNINIFTDTDLIDNAS